MTMVLDHLPTGMMLQAKVWSLDQQWRTSGVVHALEAAEVAEADTEEVDFCLENLVLEWINRW